MSVAKAFIDSNVLVYLLSEDKTKADQAEVLIRAGAIISVQVLNEITNVARRKLKMPWPELNEFMTLVQSLCPAESLTIGSHEQGRQVTERYGLSVYDAMIVSSALLAGCERLYSEDMQDGLVINDQLRICNPFARAD